MWKVDWISIEVDPALHVCISMLLQLQLFTQAAF
jgi:hypothetical protein